MIVQDAGEHLLLIPQPDHAELARRIMECWPPLASSPRRAAILLAIPGTRHGVGRIGYRASTAHYHAGGAGRRTAATEAPLSRRMMWPGLRSRVGTRAMRRRGFLQLVMAPDAEPAPGDAERLAKLFVHDLADQPPIVAHQLRAMRAADLTAQLPMLAGLPTLVVSAAHDPIAPPSAGLARVESA